MNVLILNASPRPKGNISRMLGAMEEEAVKAGMQVMSVRVSDLHVVPCKGCMVCRTKQACVLPEDDAQRVLQLIGACDVLVIGAPCYWGNMPGTLKVLFDRLVYGMMGESLQGIPQPLHKGKRAMLLSTCTTPFPFNVFSARAVAPFVHCAKSSVGVALRSAPRSKWEAPKNIL